MRENDPEWRSLEQFAFGDEPELADRLAELVLQGRKRATCWAASEGPLTHIGKRMVMRDGSGTAKAIIETVELPSGASATWTRRLHLMRARATALSLTGGARIATISGGAVSLRRICCSIASGSGWSAASPDYALLKVPGSAANRRHEPGGSHAERGRALR
jgi:hypothetical protein